MNSTWRTTALGAALSLALVLLGSVLCQGAGPRIEKPLPKVIKLDKGGGDYLQVPAGPPESTNAKVALDMDSARFFDLPIGWRGSSRAK